MDTNYKRPIPYKATHPGEILFEELRERGIKQKDFAAQIGMHPSHLNELLKGKRDINSDIAIKLERQLGIPYDNWMNMQSGYEYDCKAIAEREIRERESAKYEQECAKIVNINYLYKHLDITSVMSLKRIGRLTEIFPFDLCSSDGLRRSVSGMYKHSKKVQADDRNMNTWLLLNWLETSRSTVETEYAHGNAVKAAEEIAAMANSRNISINAVKQCLNSHGIAYIEVPTIEKAPVDAYSTFANGHPCITVTYRRNDMDKLAFDILHELCHIDRHLSSDEDRAFIDIDGVDYSKDPREKEANAFARRMLIPDNVWRQIILAGSKSLAPHQVVKTIADEACKHGISPSIAVSRYKHDKGWCPVAAFRSPKIV